MTGLHLAQYRIDAELGRGGMGIVYRATDTKLDRTVALKVLPASALGSEEDRARFYREAKAAAQLHHPNIASVFQIDEAVALSQGEEPSAGAEKRPFIAMEFIDGVTLSDRVRSAPLKLTEAVSIAAQVAEALRAAHAKDIVHRDIKSANVMLTKDGVAKVLDFGLAKTAASTQLTRQGSTLGTVAYMSPEQARGQEVDSRTDLYSLGTIFYEMVAGRLPYPGDYEQAVVYGILNEDPEPLTSLRTGVPMGLEWIVNKLLAKRPEDRYQHTDELLVDLRTVDLQSAGMTRVSRAPAAVAATSGGGRRASGKTWAIVAGTLVVGAVLGAVFGYRLAPTAAREVTYSELRVHSAWLRHPDLSADGRFLVYVGTSGTDEANRVFVYDFRTGETASYVMPTGAGGTTFSPNGSQIAFVSNGQLQIMPVTGGRPIELAPAAFSGLAWIDESNVVYATPSGERLMRFDTESGQSTSIMERGDGRSLTPLQTLTGGRILVNRDGGNLDNQDLVILDPETGDVDLVLENDGFDGRISRSGHLLYSPDARQLFARRIDLETGAVSGVPWFVGETSIESTYAISASGRFVILSESNYGARDLVRVRRDGSAAVIGVAPLDFEEIRISPDGRRVAAEVNRYNGRYDQVVIIDMTGEPTSQRLTDESSNYEPAWSPDGSRIVYSSEMDARGRTVIVERAADGSGSPRIVLSDADPIGYVDVSRDGRFISYQEDVYGPGGTFVGVYSLEDSTEVYRLREAGAVYRYPKMSPDGHFLAYVKVAGGGEQVWVSSTDGESSLPVTSAGGDMPAWSADGTTLYFVRGSTIFAVPVTTSGGFRRTGPEREVFRSDRSFYYDVMPDGDGFVIAVSRNEALSASVRVIDNFFEVLDRAVPKGR